MKRIIFLLLIMFAFTYCDEIISYYSYSPLVEPNTCFINDFDTVDYRFYIYHGSSMSDSIGTIPSVDTIRMSDVFMMTSSTACDTDTFILWQEIFPSILEHIYEGNELIICGSWIRGIDSCFQNRFLPFLGTKTYIYAQNSECMCDSVYGLSSHDSIPTPDEDCYGMIRIGCFIGNNYTKALIDSVDTLITAASGAIIASFPILPIAIAPKTSYYPSGWWGTPPDPPYVIIGLTWFGKGKVFITSDSNVIPYYNWGMDTSCNCIYGDSLLYDQYIQCYWLEHYYHRSNYYLLKNILNSSRDTTLLPGYDFVFRGAPFVVGVDLQTTVYEDSFLYDRAAYIDSPIIQSAMLGNWVAWERQANEYFSEYPSFANLPDSLYIRFAVDCETGHFFAAPIWAGSWVDTSLCDTNRLLSVFAYEGVSTAYNWWKPLCDGDKLTESWLTALPLQNLLGKAMAIEYDRLVQIGALADTLPRLRNYDCSDSSIIAGEYWGFNYLPQWFDNRTEDTLKIIRARLQRICGYDSVDSDCGRMNRLDLPDWRYVMAGNNVWRVEPDSFGVDTALGCYELYGFENDFLPEYSYFRFSGWCTGAGYAGAELYTSFGDITLGSIPDSTTTSSFSNTEMWQIELFGDGNYFADASYVILGGSGEITDIHMFPWTPETSCPEPIIHIYPPGTTYVEWNPHPNSVPVSTTISDGEGIFHILSGSIDTLYISFALPPGYSINPYGAKIVDAEYVNFSVYADVVNPDGAAKKCPVSQSTANRIYKLSGRFTKDGYSLKYSFACRSQATQLPSIAD